MRKIDGSGEIPDLAANLKKGGETESEKDGGEKVSSAKVIPSLRDPRELARWQVDVKGYGAANDNNWSNNGDVSFKEEFGRISEKILEQGYELLKRNKGKLKIVSLGAGEMRGILELRDALIKKARELGFEPKITIHEFALTNYLTNKGLDLVGGVAKDSEAGEIVLQLGSVEIADMSEAEGADLVVSAKGPIFHAISNQIRLELVQKLAALLNVQGKAFLEVGMFDPESNYIKFIKENILHCLNESYSIILESGYLVIERF